MPQKAAAMRLFVCPLPLEVATTALRAAAMPVPGGNDAEKSGSVGDCNRNDATCRGNAGALRGNDAAQSGTDAGRSGSTVGYAP
jgi:hypothetical protein